MSETTTESTPAPSTGAITLLYRGHALSIDPEFQKRKELALADATAVVRVTSEVEAIAAREAKERLVKWRTGVEASRKLAKEPILKAAAAVDEFAKQCYADTQLEESRINGLLLTFSTEQEKIRQQAAADALLKRQEAEKAAAEAAAAQARATEAARITALTPTGLAGIAAQARALDEAQAAQEEAKAKEASAGDHSLAADALQLFSKSKTVATIKVSWDFEVTDIIALHAAHPELVTLTAKTGLVIEKLKEQAALGQTPSLPGINVIKKEKV